MKRALVKLLYEKNYTLHAKPGDKVRVWGYDFLVTPDHECVLIMPIEAARNEASANRVKIIDYIDDPEAKSFSIPETEQKIVPVPIQNTLNGDPAKYFGFESKIEFRKKITEFTKWQLIDFAKEKFNVVLPVVNNKNKIIETICEITENLNKGATQ